MDVIDRINQPADRAPLRDRPYGLFIDRAFDRDLHCSDHRHLLRFLYRQFRAQEHSSPFSARAQIANVTMRLERVAYKIVPDVAGQPRSAASGTPHAAPVSHGDSPSVAPGAEQRAAGPVHATGPAAEVDQ